MVGVVIRPCDPFLSNACACALMRAHQTTQHNTTQTCNPAEIAGAPSAAADSYMMTRSLPTDTVTLTLTDETHKTFTACS